MTTNEQSTRWRRIADDIKGFWRRELPVLFVWGAIMVGALNFLLVVDNYWQALPERWWWLVIAVATLNVPRVFRRLRESKEPLSVRFALAFREGFLSLPQISLELSAWKQRMVRLWENTG